MMGMFHTIMNLGFLCFTFYQSVFKIDAGDGIMKCWHQLSEIVFLKPHIPEPPGHWLIYKIPARTYWGQSGVSPGI